MAPRQLEDEVGGPLFETDRKNSLTAIGSFILESGRVQVGNCDRGIGRIRAFARNRIGRPTLATVPSAVEDGQTGLGIAGQPSSNTLVSFGPLFRDRFTIICSASCHLARLGRPIEWSDLDTEVVIRNGAAETIEPA